MYCFVCVTYMIILTSANPWIAREPTTKPEQRSLFRDVIESLRIRSRPENTNQDDNNLLQGYERYGYDHETLQLPSDADFMPRRNDRVEMPRLKLRFPKNLEVINGEKIEIKESIENPKERISEKSKNSEVEAQAKEVVVFVDTHSKPYRTQKPKLRPQFQNRYKPNKNKENDNYESQESQETQAVSTEDYMQLTNTMAGQSQIGNRETQTVIKPTVIVNLRGTVSHADSDIKLERKGINHTDDNIPRNIFNITQEINLDRTTPKKEQNKVKQDIKTSKERSKGEEDMMMCETVYKQEEKLDGARKFDNVLQILFSI